jgi:hypothetical protein
MSGARSLTAVETGNARIRVLEEDLVNVLDALDVGAIGRAEESVLVAVRVMVSERRVALLDCVPVS